MLYSYSESVAQPCETVARDLFQIDDKGALRKPACDKISTIESII